MHHKKRTSSDNRNLLLAVVLSALILGGFEMFYRPQLIEQQRDYAAAVRQQAQKAEAEKQKPPKREILALDQALRKSARLPFENGRVKGSIALLGGRIDDVILTDYRETIDPQSPHIRLLMPENAAQAYYADFGWVGEKGISVPGPDSLWQSPHKKLTTDTPVILQWDNGQGLLFEKIISIDADYMLHVEQRVVNNGAQVVSLTPYSLIARYQTPPTLGFFVLHEGLLGVFDGTLHETTYADLQEEKSVTAASSGGWLGITDKYWLAALVPDQADEIKARFAYTQSDGVDRYQADFTGKTQDIAPGATAVAATRFFAGAKEVKLLDRYEENLQIANFDLAVDFGWFYFLTKPLFLILHALYLALGSFGLAILVLTVLVKLCMYPLANKSYRAMNRLKELQPEMMALREQYKDDMLRMQKEMAAFYQRNQVNPLSGCLPILIQIPVFFALYKVLFVTIEMRHQAFYGWIKDLSAPDPTTIFNLFGLLDWTPPDHFLFIPLYVGAWPVIMGFTMWLQQKLNPAPMDNAQKVVFGLFPFLFTFLLAAFPAGLVIYWSWSNLLGILQQYHLKRDKRGEKTVFVGTKK